MSTNKPSWMTAEAIHLPESTSEMFVYHPVDDLDAVVDDRDRGQRLPAQA
jgi:hypothetical protein